MIDFHTHCFPEALAPRALIKSNIHHFYETDASIEGQLLLAKRKNIRKFAVLNIANTPKQERDVNRFALEIHGKENMVISFGTVHPYSPDALEQIDYLYENGIRGIKFQPIRQRFCMDEAICWPVFRHIGELGMLTVIHGGRSVRTDEYPVLPDAMKKCIDNFCGEAVIVSHMGGMFLNEEEIRKMSELPILTDTALCVRHLSQDKFNRAVGLFGPDRILFGTDMPWACMEEEISFIENASLTRGEREKIFDGNAEKLIRRYHLEKESESYDNSKQRIIEDRS